MRTNFLGVLRWIQASSWAAAACLGLAGSAWADQSIVNLNAASAQVLAEHLHGVGETTAMRIVAYREANGPFRRIEDLVLVQGIGDRLLERNRARLVLEAPETEAEDTRNAMRTE